MASKNRPAENGLDHQLATIPQKFSFLQAVHLLENRLRAAEKQPVGYDASPDREFIRFVGHAARSFPASEIVSIEQDEQNCSVVISVAFMGLYGPNGVLPDHDTQRIIDEQPEPTSSVTSAVEKNASPLPFRARSEKRFREREFLDLFLHRMISFFYRASTKYRLPFSYESFYLHGFEDESQPVLQRVLFSLAGLGTPGHRNRLTIEDEFLLSFSGLFRGQSKNAVSLAQLVTGRVGLPARVLQFRGQWLQLSETNLSIMPNRGMILGRNCQLGKDFIVGEQVWDVMGKFTILLGPLRLEEFNSLLPGSRNLEEISQIARQYAGAQLDFDIQLELLAEEVPQSSLDGETRLGLNSWVLSAPLSENRTDAAFALMGMPTR